MTRSAPCHPLEKGDPFTCRNFMDPRVREDDNTIPSSNRLFLIRLSFLFAKMPAHTKAIVSLKSTTLSEEERTLLKTYHPLGVIVMGRNVAKKDQLKRLCAELREYVPYILIDQEGGAVRRLHPPEFYDAQKDTTYFGTQFDKDPRRAIQELTQQTECIARDLKDCYINVNCAPILDLLYDHPAIEKHVISFYKRAFHKNPKIVSLMGEVVCRTFLEAGITPVVKHIPGHGRSAGADPHEGVCHVYGELIQDIIPFHHIVETGLPVWGMTNHVIYDTLDPTQPTAFSPVVVKYIRDHVGFQGFLMTDAIDMKALNQTHLSENVTKALNSGHDAVLYCAGVLSETETILKAAQIF